MLIPFLPVVGEIAFDHWRWKNGKDDKPLSTYLRVVAFVFLAIGMAFIVGVGNAWVVLITAGIFLFATHLLFFDYSLNVTRKGKHIFYHADGELWNVAPWYGELFIKLVVYWSAWVAFFHWNWVCCGEYPTKLIEYFMF